MSYHYSESRTQEWSIGLSDDEQPADELMNMLADIRSMHQGTEFRNPEFESSLTWKVEARSGHDHLVITLTHTEYPER